MKNPVPHPGSASGPGARIRGGRVADRGRAVAWVAGAEAPGEPEGPVARPRRRASCCRVSSTSTATSSSRTLSALPGDGGFVPRVEKRRGHPRAVSTQEEAGATAEAIRSLEQRGTVAVGDVSNALAHLDALAASQLDGVVFQELLAWDPARAQASLEWAEERAGRGRGAAASGPRGPPRGARAALGVAALFALPAERGGPAAIHLAESTDETGSCSTAAGTGGLLDRRGPRPRRFAPPGLSPVRYAERLGVLHPRLVAAHGVQLDADDRGPGPARRARRPLPAQ